MFLGYNQTNSKCTLKHIFHNRNEVKNVEKNNKNIILIFDKTPFYAEAGGQVGDSGKLYSSEKKLIARINDTQKIDGDIFLHFLEKNEEKISVNKNFFLIVDEKRREK